jgi:uroporphyrinogen decarboxylase
MTMREVVRLVLDGGRPPYVPWSFGFTQEAKARLVSHFGTSDLDTVLHNHLLKLGSDIGFFVDIGDNCVQDVFGVVWDRSVDKDIGIVKGCVLPKASLKGYTFPDPLDPRFFADIPDRIARHGDRFRVFQIGFSLYERAWTLRGLLDLMTDFYDHPAFVRELLNTIADYNLAQVREALRYDIDAVYFGDDWGQQRGLQMGPILWREFLRPVLQRMYAGVRLAGKYVMIHSCGDVDELFDDLIEIGVNCFNPFQPEVMDVEALMRRYRGRWAFHGGLSTQRTLPYGSPEDVRREARWLIELGEEGGYLFAPAHDVEGDVPLENMLGFIEVALGQPGFGEERTGQRVERKAALPNEPSGPAGG